VTPARSSYVRAEFRREVRDGDAREVVVKREHAAHGHVAAVEERRDVRLHVVVVGVLHGVEHDALAALAEVVGGREHVVDVAGLAVRREHERVGVEQLRHRGVREVHDTTGSEVVGALDDHQVLLLGEPLEGVLHARAELLGVLAPANRALDERRRVDDGLQFVHLGVEVEQFAREHRVGVEGLTDVALQPGALGLHVADVRAAFGGESRERERDRGLAGACFGGCDQ